MANGVNNHQDRLIINDLEMRIAPTAIKITKDSFNYQWQTLRTNTSQKTKSGHSTITIEFTLPFVGDLDIHTKLKPLIAQLRYMPFCFVENQFIRENIFPKDSLHSGPDNSFANSQTIVLAMRAASISARNDTPGTLWANFQFAYFNYLPYTPHWQYKVDLEGDGALKSVTFPKDSAAWQKFIAPVVGKSTVAQSKSGSANIQFLELRTAPTTSTQSISDTKQVLSSISKDQKLFFDNFRTNIQPTVDGTIVDAIKKSFPQFSSLQDIAAADLLGPLLINAGPNSNPLSKRYRADGQYIDQNELKKVLGELDERFTEKQQIEDGSNKNNSGYELIPGLTFQDNRGGGFGVYKRIRDVNLNPSAGIIIEGITISIQNILATIPIISHRYATFQHIGSIDASVILDIKITNDSAMKTLGWMYDTVNDNMLNNRHIPQGLQTIRIDNDILALFNLKEFVTEDMESATIEGQPGTYNVKLSFIESGLKQNDTLDVPPNEKFNVEFASQDQRVAKEITRILNNNIKLDNSRFISTVNASRSARFASIVNKYLGYVHTGSYVNDAINNAPGANLNGGPNANFFALFFGDKNTPSDQAASSQITSTVALNTFTNDVANIILSTKQVTSQDIYDSLNRSDHVPIGSGPVGNVNQFNALMALTEDDVPGISKVQEAIQLQVKQNSQLNQNLTSLANKPLADVLANARATVANGSTIDTIRRQQALYQKINFDPSDVPFVPSTIGLNTAPPSTLEGQKFDDLLKNSTDTLLNSSPFVHWAEFISNLTTAIIESDDIDLTEFASAKKLVSDLRLGRGLPAYADFELENILAKTDQDNIDKILSLDPDCFLFTSTDASLDDFIDPALIANAKRTAQISAQSAVAQIDQFYNDSWFPSFISDSIKNKIKANLAITVKQQGTDGTVNASRPASLDDYYAGSINLGTYTNAGSSQKITLGALNLDPKQIHASDYTPQQLAAQNTITHSLNPADLFNLNNSNVPDQNPTSGLKQVSNQKNKPVTKSTMAPDGSIDQSPDKLKDQANTSLEIYALARMIASEESGKSGPMAKLAVAWAAKNYAASHNTSISHVLLSNKNHPGTFGSQRGGYASSSRDPNSDDINVATQVINNQTPDPTGGAIKWLHLSNFEATIKNQYIVSGAKPPSKVISASDVIASRENDGLQQVEVTGVDPNQLILFRNPKNKKQFAYTPPAAPAPSPDTGINAGTNVADMAIAAFQSSIQNGQGLRLVRAFPAFKLYFIQDNSSNRRRFGLDDFFSYNSVVDITCVRSRKIPADLCEITLTNVSGVLSNRKFQNARVLTNKIDSDPSTSAINAQGQEIVRDPNGFLDRNSNNTDNALASMMLQPGVDVELRLGTANDPDKLTTVFNGKVMEVEFSESDDLVKIICQSHVIEMVQNMKGLTEPVVKDGFFVSDARTDLLLEQLMAEPELVHFGRWVRSQTFNSDSNTNRFLLTNKFNLHPTPQDDNIFVPPIEKLRQLDPGFLFSGLKYSIFQTTIWDVFDEMTLRHPGYIKCAVPYKGKEGPRMTMFFGLPSQLYFAADPSNEEKNQGSQLRSQVDQYNNNIEQLNKSYVLNPDLMQPDPQDNNRLKSKLQTRDFAAERLTLAKDFQTIKPFRAYHLVTSKNHIISNTIRASAKDTHNTVSVQYGKSTFNKDTQKLVQEDTDVLTLSVDAALPDEEIRELFVQYANCQSELLAKNYALASLMKELKDVYRGELTIIGNAEIKPYDIVYIFDDYSDIMGPVEVEQVIHRFSQDTGFITEITPDLFVTSNEWVNMTATDMMSIITEGAASALTHGTPTTTENIISSPVTKAAALTAFAVGIGAAPLIAILGAGAAIGGYFMMQKMVDFSSHGQPVVVHPLIHRGKPFVAGLPISKLNNLWSTNKGQWFKEAFDGIGLWLDDFDDKLVLAVSQGNITNLFTGNNIPAQF